MAVLAGKLEAGRSDCAPVAGKSTLNRLELSRDRPTKYCEIAHDAAAVEGVFVESEAVLGAGVVLTASTPIVDVRASEPVVTRGRVPARAVVIPGTLPKHFPAGEFGTPCALIVGTRDASTDRKTSLNAALREHEVAV